MSWSVQAVAVDYDGTFTDADVPDGAVLEALRTARENRRAVVLVTGRILSELRTVFPGAEGEFDAIVAENGAVLCDAEGIHDLATPVAPTLGQALAHRDVTVHQGRVLLACDTRHSHSIRDRHTRESHRLWCGRRVCR